MGTITKFRTPKHRRRHLVCSSYLAAQNDSAWEEVKKAVLEEVGLPEYLENMDAALSCDTSTMAMAITTISTETTKMKGRM